MIENILTRECPSCKKEIIYSSKYECKRANDSNSVCATCKNKKFGGLNTKKKLSSQQLEELILLAKEGQDLFALSEKYNRTKSVICRVLRKHGIEQRNTRPVADKISDVEFRCSKCKLIKHLNEFKKTRSKGKISYCRTCLNEQNTVSENEKPIRLFNQRAKELKAKSIKNNIVFDLTGEFLEQLFHNQSGLCFYTGEPMVIERGNGTQRNTASVDRLVPEKGYIKDNVVFCMYVINRVKTDLSLLELCKWMPTWHKKIVDKLNADNS